MLYDSTYMGVTRVVKSIQTESGTVGARGWAEAEVGGCCFMGTEFQFCKMKRVLEMDEQQCECT